MNRPTQVFEASGNTRISSKQKIAKSSMSEYAPEQALDGRYIKKTVLMNFINANHNTFGNKPIVRVRQPIRDPQVNHFLTYRQFPLDQGSITVTLKRHLTDVSTHKTWHRMTNHTFHTRLKFGTSKTRATQTDQSHYERLSFEQVYTNIFMSYNNESRKVAERVFRRDSGLAEGG